MTRSLWLVYFEIVIRLSLMTTAFELPGSCKAGEYYEPGMMVCQPCAGNASLVTSADGFACACEDHSVFLNPGRCKPCGATALLSADGTACVPRKCQGGVGKMICRRCPADYISVTQNFDGSPMKEVLCVKCARGFKSVNNACVRCAACVCAKHEVAVRDICVPTSFVNARPKYEGGMHLSEVLDVIKHEYLCIQHDYRACRALASACVTNFYPSEAAGPCRLWLQPNVVQHKGLPPLLIGSGNDKEAGIDLPRGKETLKLALTIHTSSGGLKILQFPSIGMSPCFSAIEITVGEDFTRDCLYNVTDPPLSEGDTVSPYLQMGGDLTPLPVAQRKPTGHLVQRVTWPSSKFRRYFFIHNYLSTTTNTTSTVYLRTLLIRLRMQRNKTSLGTHMTIEAQYATKPSYTRSITTTLKVQHEMPSAGVLRGLEIWGGVLGALCSCYAVIQWRGVLRRGGPPVSLVPLLSGSIADAMYFALLLATLHALAAEVSSYGMSLPPSSAEEYIIRAFVYSTICLKVIKAAWVNWKQCSCDIFFLDWSEYNPPVKDILPTEDNTWKTMTLAREWSAMQTRRRVEPGVTITIALIVLHFLSPWRASLPHSPGYTWAAGSVAWWCAYVPVLLARNNDFPDSKSMSGPLETCRVVCAPQLRAVYKQLATPGLGHLMESGYWLLRSMDIGNKITNALPTLRTKWNASFYIRMFFTNETTSIKKKNVFIKIMPALIPGALDENDTRQKLLSRFLAAFFERALDGLSWVASERTVLERLLDVELVTREAGNTSVLLYDPDSAPSCYIMCWWGEEWTLATLDAMLFGCVLLATGDWLLAALVALVMWQVAKQLRGWFGDRNLKQHVGIESIE